jgi:hypothetical protein
VRENRTPGSVRGLLGNWQSYRDAGIEKRYLQSMKRIADETRNIEAVCDRL